MHIREGSICSVQCVQTICNIIYMEYCSLDHNVPALLQAEFQQGKSFRVAGLAALNSLKLK